LLVEFNRLDVSMKELVWDDPAACLDRWGIGPVGPVEVIESAITALTAAADKVIRVEGDHPYLVVIEPQSHHDADLVETLWFRQAALFHRHRLPVLTILVLMSREANSPRVTGTFEISMPDGWRTNEYNYRVVRLWQEDPEQYLTAGVNLVPLVPLTNVAQEALPKLLPRMAERINAEAEHRALRLWTATYLLMGLRFERSFASQLLEGVQNMRESTTYQAILKEGREEGLAEGRRGEAQRLILLQGEIRFGAADEATRATVEAIRDLDRLESLSKRLFDSKIDNWDDLLGTP
jgi:predicted transposase YdaD